MVLKSFPSLSNITLLFLLYVRCPSTILKFLKDSEISFLSFIFRYIFRETFTSNKILFYFQENVFIACHLSKICLQSERTAWFCLSQNFKFFIFNFLSRTIRCSWIFCFSPMNVFSGCHLFKILLQSKRKAWFYLAQNIRLFISKTFKCLFRKRSCFLKIAVPEFQK